MRLLLDEDFAVGMITFMIGEDDIQNILRAPWRAMGTDGLLGGRPHPRAYGSCPRILGHYSRDLGLLTLEEAIFRMTGLTAWRLGLRDRGLVRPGYRADLVIFDADRIADRATYDRPHAYPEGIRWVLVNGQVILRDGARLPALPGRVLRRAGNGLGRQVTPNTKA